MKMTSPWLTSQQLPRFPAVKTNVVVDVVVIGGGITKVAAYRDDQGKVTLCSPICTHLKCIAALEFGGTDVGLPLPRLAIQTDWRSHVRAGEEGFGKD